MDIREIIPWRAASRESRAPAIRLATDLVLAGVCYPLFRRSPWVQWCAISSFAVLAAGEGVVLKRPLPAPVARTASSQESYYRMSSLHTSQHPYNQTTPDLTGKSPMCFTGIVSPREETLKVYKGWFERATALEIRPGAWYYYQTEAEEYTFCFLTKEGPVERKRGPMNPQELSSWLGKIESELGVNLVPINFALMMEIQNQITLKFQCKEEEIDWTTDHVTVHMEWSDLPLTERPLQESLKLKVGQQNLSQKMAVTLSPYALWLGQEKLIDFGTIPHKDLLDNKLLNMPNELANRLASKVKVRSISPPPSRTKLERRQSVESLLESGKVTRSPFLTNDEK
ncbi:MAG: hypothetical protein AB7F31_04540 [Parachlamydiales bacterium]